MDYPYIKGILTFMSILLISNFAMCCESSLDEEISFEPLFRYDLPTNLRYAQGMDIYDGCVFQAFSDGTIDVFDLGTGNKIQTLGPLLDEEGMVLHMNDLTFLQSDGSTCLITSGNRINTNIHLFKLAVNSGKFNIEKEELLSPPMIDETINKETIQYFGAGEYCVQVGYRHADNDGYGDSLIECYRFEPLSQEIKYSQMWSRVYNKLWAMQGAVIIGDNCFMAVGVPHGEAKIYRINLNNGDLSCYKDFRKSTDLIPNEEMQGLTFYDNSFYFSTTYGLYKLL